MRVPPLEKRVRTCSKSFLSDNKSVLAQPSSFLMESAGTLSSRLGSLELCPLPIGGGNDLRLGIFEGLRSDVKPDGKGFPETMTAQYALMIGFETLFVSLAWLALCTCAIHVRFVSVGHPRHISWKYMCCCASCAGFLWIWMLQQRIQPMP